MKNFNFFFAVMSAIGGSAFNHGFQLGLLNILIAMVYNWITQITMKRTTKVIKNMDYYIDWVALGPFILASFSLGAVIGATLIGLLANLGRKKAIIITDAITVAGLFLLTAADFTDSYGFLIGGRIVVGVAVGISSGVTLIYIVEISPHCCRGKACSFYYVVVCASMTFAYVLALPEAMGDEEKWRYIFIVCFVPPIAQAISMLYVCPETPKFLYFNEEDEEATEDALAWLLNEENIDQELYDLEEELLILRESNFRFRAICSDQIFRSPLLVSVVITFGQQVCGVDAFMYYSTTAVYQFGVEYNKAMYYTVGLGVCNIIVSFISMMLVDKIGRRPLLLVSFIGMIISGLVMNILFGLTESQRHENIYLIAVILLFFYVGFFGLGAGSIPWFYPAELTSHFARPWSVSIAVFTGWLCHFVIVMIYLAIKILLHEYFLLISLIFSIFAVIFLMVTMRETAMMYTVDIAELFYD